MDQTLILIGITFHVISSARKDGLGLCLYTETDIEGWEEVLRPGVGIKWEKPRLVEKVWFVATSEQ
jgi:hypothetical protein